MRNENESYIAHSGRNSSAKPQTGVHIRVDRYAKYAIVAQTLADLQRRGLRMIGFVNNEYL